MKKLILSIAVLSSMISQAQSTEPQIFDDETTSLSIIAPELSGGNNAIAASLLKPSTDTSPIITVYDENFKKITSFVTESDIVDTTYSEDGRTFPVSFKYLHNDGNSLRSYEDQIVTKSFFSNDNLFEYIIPVVENRRDSENFGSDGVEEYIMSKIVGYRINNERGEVICTITFPENYFQKTDGQSEKDCTIYNLKGKLYISTILVSLDISGDWWNPYLVVMEINKSSSAAQVVMIQEIPSKRIQAIVREKNVMVKIPQSDTDTQLSLFDMTGSNVLTANVEEGMTEKIIDCSHIPSGIYILRAGDDSNLNSSCKIVLK